MKLSNEITQDGIFQEIDRRCKSNLISYPSRDKTARVNAALDRYFHLAFKSDGRWNFDDINQSSPPIEAQSIVSGTNRYKMSDFTSKILSVIRIEALDSDGNGLFLIPEMLNDIGVVYPGNASGQLRGTSANTFQELYVNASSGVPTHYIKYGDFIYLRPNPNYSEADGLLAYFNRPASKFDFNTFTVTQATPGLFTLVAHGFSVNDTIMLQTDGSLLTGLAVDTVYYIKALDGSDPDDKFTVAATKGGDAINTTGTQSGVHYLLETSKVPGIPETHHPYLARHASYPYLVEKEMKSKNDIKRIIIEDEMAIREHFSRRDKDTKHGIRVRMEDCH